MYIYSMVSKLFGALLGGSVRPPPLVLTSGDVDAQEVRAGQRGDVVQRLTAEDAHHAFCAADKDVAFCQCHAARAGRLQADM